ncbi:beta strand repeat-containing protein [Brevundimonas lenta]|uniref:Ca2+-binding RTX toxin-like protein n=1 Tax=Brevundimonas lenta TaxID=424796 RepID=A0A7W6JB54_9CAUL|nr:FG-GAP-like repeat-containing protein [Brevundimonas lenta]MBB4081895.1 Ca2+-binding RTX toxin-like protein [Brevundimonas lenta]
MPVTFSEQDTSTFPLPAAGGRMNFVDVDGDGDMDILFQTGANGTAFQYARSNGDGTYTILALGSSPFAGLTLPDHNGGNFHFGDIDGDGDMDLWAGQASGAGTGSYFRNDNGTFTAQSSSTFPQPGAASRVAMGDFDGDGDADMLYQTVGNGTPFQYARSNGDGTYTLLALASSPFAGLTLPDNGGGTHYVADFDGDGDVDIWATVASNTGSYFVNNGNGTFSAGSASTFPAAAAITRHVIGDFDSDGDADILYQTGADGTVWQYARSNGDGTMTILSQAASPFAGVSLVNHNGSNFMAGDIDGDGDDDILGTVNGTQGEFYLANGKPPEIASSTPSDNATGVAVGANIVLTFDESVTKGSGNIYIYRGDGTLIETISVGSAQVSGSGTTWTIDPSVTLAGLTNYYILTDDGIFADADGSIFAGISDAITLNFTTAAANTAPTFINMNGDMAAFTEGAPVQVDVGGNAIITDAEQANFNGGTLTFTITNNGVAAQDVLSIANNGTAPGLISVSGNAVSYGGVQIGTFTGGTAGAALVVTLDPDATPAATQAVVRALRYNNTSDAPNTATRTITTVLTDGAGGTSATQTNSVTLTAVNDVHTGGASITGSAAEDQVLTAVSTLVDPDGLGTLHYQWQRDTGGGYVNVGADQATYTLGDADVGGVVRVVIYYTDAGGTVESATSAGTAAVAAVNDPHTGGAVISGTVSENQVLTAVSTLADPDGLGTLHYDWQRNTGSGFVSIGAADQATYTLGDADVGASVRVVISYTDGQGFSESATSGASPTIAGVNDPHTGGASISGTATEDQVLTAVSTLADADGLGTLHYDWQRDTGSGFVSIGAADQATYTLGGADVGGVVRVVISYTDGQGFSESATSAGTAAVANVNDAPTGGVSITGTATEDQVLTADTSTLADADGLGTLHYDWQRDTGSGFVSIGAADQATYTLGDADVGGSIRVVVSYTDGSGTAETATSAGTNAIVNVDDAAVAVDDSDATLESAVLSGSVVANDTDIDGPAFVVTHVNGSAAGVGTEIALASGALLTLNADGTYSYNPNGSFTHLSGPASGGTNLTATDSFTYTLLDGNTATVTITIVGEDSPGDDVQGDSGDNILTAGDGEDTLIGGAGDDTLDGGDGEDTADYSGSTGGVHIRLNGGFGTDGEGGTDTLTNIENLTGSANNDILIGANGGNTLSGGAGADVLIGLDGNDVLVGGAGAANQLQGGTGDDSYWVEANDTIIELPNQGHDRIFTSRNAMTLVANVEELHFTGAGNFSGTGNALDNTIVGGAGNDLLSGRGGDDTLHGGSGGVDTVTYATAAAGVVASLFHGATFDDGDGGADDLVDIENLIGSAFTDTLMGDAGANVLMGGGGDDWFEGHGGNDLMNGGIGTDTANYFASSGAVTVRLDGATAQDGEGGTDTLVSIENVVGTTQDDFIVGNAVANHLQGANGRDILMGMGGADILEGGNGAANTLFGGAGDDLYIVTANDTIIELTGEGTDSVQTNRNQFTLAANVENLTFTGSGDFAGTGNASSNVITGGAGRDTLTGGGGNDTLNGGQGHDTARFTGSASQYLVEALGGGQYRVTDTVGGRDGVDILNSVEQIRFLDSTVVIGAVSTPELTTKDMGGGAQVLPDDDFLFATFDSRPQVLPTLFDDDGALASSGGFDGLALAPVFREAHGQDGSLHLIDSWHTHDDWMF